LLKQLAAGVCLGDVLSIVLTVRVLRGVRAEEGGVAIGVGAREPVAGEKSVDVRRADVAGKLCGSFAPLDR